MTIAACHLSPEGVVLGADSATTLMGRDGRPRCYFDYAQKLFEIGGPGSTVGLVTWGMGQIGPHSHRAIAAEVGEKHRRSPYTSMEALATGVGKVVWEYYSAAYANQLTRTRELMFKAESNQATAEELAELDRLFELTGGYCVAGRCGECGPCSAYEVLWGPEQTEAKIEALAPEAPIFFGLPDIMQRLVFGLDSALLVAILQSGKWSGTDQDLLDLVADQEFIAPRLLPIREAIDWVHTVIHTTIRGTKFAQRPHFCGGPVEIAVITVDRPFRWVRHKGLDAAIITTEEARR